jgi:hypothetical protein
LSFCTCLFEYATVLRFSTKKNNIWTLRLDRPKVCSTFVMHLKSEVALGVELHHLL